MKSMIYLASSSPRRRSILKKLGYPFRVIRPYCKEKPIAKASPSKVVRAHALEKATSVAHRVSCGVVLGADTLVYCSKKIIGKPRNLKQAERILSRLQGRWHTVYTGVALLKVVSGRVRRQAVFCEKTRVRIKPMDRRQIAQYFRKVHPLDKAGAYAIQSKRMRIVSEVKGSVSNAAGFPIEAIQKHLAVF